MNRKSNKNKETSTDNPVITIHESASEMIAPTNLGSARRTLYFHAGTHKTGSTALQGYLAENRDALHQAGVSYVFPFEANQLNGNGQELFHRLYQRTIGMAQLEKLLVNYFTDRMTAICSSEDFIHFSIHEWKQIQDACRVLQVEVKIVIYVRDVAPYYSSIYGESIKSGGNQNSFEVFIQKNQYAQTIESLKTLIEVFGRQEISVIHYESVSSQIDIAFWSKIGLSVEHYGTLRPLQMKNRSLSDYEQEVVRRINEISNSEFSKELAVLLMHQRPNLIVGRAVSEENLAILIARHSTDVNFINELFFDGNAVVKINNNAFSNFADNAKSAECQQAIDRDVANWCISKMTIYQKEYIEQLVKRLLSIDWRNAGHAQIPDTFDPIAYLLLNLDLLRAGVQPYEHFIRTGQHESKRRWAWTN